MTIFSSALMKRLSWAPVASTLAMLSVPAASLGHAPTQDSAVGSGSTRSYASFEFEVTSGPLGENTTGGGSATTRIGLPGGGETFGGPSTCLSVSGNTATFAGPLAPNSFGFTFGKVTVKDIGPTGSGLDTYNAAAFTVSTRPDCSPLVGTGGGSAFGEEPLLTGDIVVIDAQAARMVGKGSVSGGSKVASYAYLVPCGAAAGSSPPLEVRFNAQRFRLTSVDSVSCSDDPGVSTPAAGFDTQTGSGTGTLTTGGPGKLAWKFVDDGAGGANDSVQLTIRNASNAIVFQGSAAPPGPFPGSNQATGRNTAR